jgi:hypothetical protein
VRLCCSCSLQTYNAMHILKILLTLHVWALRENIKLRSYCFDPAMAWSIQQVLGLLFFRTAATLSQ